MSVLKWISTAIHTVDWHWTRRFFFYIYSARKENTSNVQHVHHNMLQTMFTLSSFLIKILQMYYHSSSSLSFSLRVSPNKSLYTSFMPFWRNHSVPPTYVWEPAERGHCTKHTHCIPLEGWLLYLLENYCIPRCSNLLQLFHKCLVNYYWSESRQIAHHKL